MHVLLSPTVNLPPCQPPGRGILQHNTKLPGENPLPNWSCLIPGLCVMLPNSVPTGTSLKSCVVRLTDRNTLDHVGSSNLCVQEGPNILKLNKTMDCTDMSTTYRTVSLCAHIFQQELTGRSNEGGRKAISGFNFYIFLLVSPILLQLPFTFAMPLAAKHTHRFL